MLSLPSKSLGARLRELRTAQKLSMRALAAKAGLRSPAFIADLENGFRFPSSEVMEKLAEALCIDLRDLQTFDRRAPISELRDLTEQNPAWAFALRRLVQAAEKGEINPESLVNLLTANRHASSQKDLPLWR